MENNANSPKDFLQGLQTLNLILGPICTTALIIWVHIENLGLHWPEYVDGPPSVSRAIVDPVIGVPFAMMINVNAVQIFFGIVTALRIHLRLFLASERRNLLTILMIVAFTIAEFSAVAGMIILSQYRGDQWSYQHNFGSYLLFFGHGIGISLSGIMFWQLRHDVTSPDLLQKFRGQVRFAIAVALVSVSYGVMYFGGHVMPDSTFFVMRLLSSATEMILIPMFVGYLAMFARLPSFK